MVDLDDRLGALRAALEQSTTPDFDDVMRRRKRTVRRQRVGALAGVVVLAAGVPLGVRALPGLLDGHDRVVQTPASTAPSAPAPVPSASAPARVTPSVAQGALPVIDECGRGIQAVRPATLTLGCDGGVTVKQLTWSSWSSSGAEATGAAVVSCPAQGRCPVPPQIRVSLSAPRTTTDAQAGSTSTAFTRAVLRPTSAALPAGLRTTYDLTPKGTVDQLAVASAWATFWDGRVPAAQKAAFVQNGASAVPDITSVFSILTPDQAVRVDSVAVTGDTATVTYAFTLGGQELTKGDATGTAVKVDGQWVVSSVTWDAFVQRSDVHGSG